MSGPVRTCVGCRTRAEQADLVRLAYDEAGGTVALDVRRRMPGRGAWLHPDATCLDEAVRRKAFGRALRRPGTPVDPARLREQLEAAPHGGVRSGSTASR